MDKHQQNDAVECGGVSKVLPTGWCEPEQPPPGKILKHEVSALPKDCLVVRGSVGTFLLFVLPQADWLFSLSAYSHARVKCSWRAHAASLWAQQPLSAHNGQCSSQSWPGTRTSERNTLTRTCINSTQSTEQLNLAQTGQHQARGVISHLPACQHSLPAFGLLCVTPAEMHNFSLVFCSLK